MTYKLPLFSLTAMIAMAAGQSCSAQVQQERTFTERPGYPFSVLGNPYDSRSLQEQEDCPQFQLDGPATSNPFNPFGGIQPVQGNGLTGQQTIGGGTVNPFGAPAAETGTLNPFGDQPATGGSTINPFGELPAAPGGVINPFDAQPAGVGGTINPFGGQPTTSETTINPFGEPSTNSPGTINPFVPQP